MDLSDVRFLKAAREEAASIVQFQLAMAKESEDLVLDPTVCAAGVNAVFERPQLGEYHVCQVKVDGRFKTVGNLLIIPEWSDWRNGMVWWIHSVYILPEYRGRGLFSAFYRHIQKTVQDSSTLRGLRLYVDKTNLHAQKVYQKIGMSNAHYDLYEWIKESKN
ncbi:MAG: GNAT family N-acetyltransferase [Bdellovibrio sp.]|nr:GNAT family N-acetyltransferase [Bdellovibrio sp.]